MQRFNKAMIAVALGLIATISISAQAQPERYLTLTPPSGLPVIPVMEGWVANPDGTTTISFGTINRNEEDDIDIPVGENNYIEPAKYNGMQPTHFPSGRRTGKWIIRSRGIQVQGDARPENFLGLLKARHVVSHDPPMELVQVGNAQARPTAPGCFALGAALG